jgi:hypothetical protein
MPVQLVGTRDVQVGGAVEYAVVSVDAFSSAPVLDNIVGEIDKRDFGED